MVSGILAGKSCLITGASRGIGKAIAIAYAKEGASLILTGRDQGKLNEVYKECIQYTKECTTFTCDLGSMDGIKNFEHNLGGASKFSEIDILVNNAGYLNTDSVSSPNNIDDWSKMMTINVLAPFHITNKVVPSMIEKKSGTIINIGSIAGTEGMTASGMYSSSKWALRGFSHHCQINLKPYNIKVMLINPAYVATDMIQGAPVDTSMVIQPEDIAEAALLPFKTSPGCCPEMLTIKIAGIPTK